MDSTWESVDLPVLEAAVRFVGDRGWAELPQEFGLAPMVGLDAEGVEKALLRLDGEYIVADRVGGGLPNIGVNKIYPAARRAVGQWPTPETVAERLLTALESAAEAEQDEDKRTKLRQVAGFLGSTGKDLLVNVLAAVIANRPVWERERHVKVNTAGRPSKREPTSVMLTLNEMQAGIRFGRATDGIMVRRDRRVGAGLG